QNPKLKLLLTADCPHWGSPPCRTSFVFDSMLRISYFLGNYYPRGGSQVFADELARRLEEHGGDILLSSRVTRILTARGKAGGIVVETGHVGARREQVVSADAVVCNGDMRQAVECLIPANALPSEYVAQVRAMRPSYPCFLMHLGLQGISEETLR